MGFSTIGGFIIMFFALLIVASAFITIQARLADSMTLSNNIQKEKITREMNTKIEIINATYDNGTSPAETTMYIRNTGSEKLDMGYVDVFIDNVRIPRDDANRTIEFAPGSDVFNPLQWDPDETIIVVVKMDLSHEAHMATATTEYGIKDAAIFSA